MMFVEFCAMFSSEALALAKVVLQIRVRLLARIDVLNLGDEIIRPALAIPDQRSI
jgi:hypothetical protein